jgi:hypothetical protein
LLLPEPDTFHFQAQVPIPMVLEIMRLLVLIAQNLYIEAH